MKDRIGNELVVGDKVVLQLPEAAMLFGFVAEVKPMSLIAKAPGSPNGVQPGHILVSCVIPFPCDAQHGMVAQVAKVYDPAAKGTMRTNAGDFQETAPN